MARDHARVQVGIWNDDDFRTLDAAAQHAYLMLASQSRLSYCGVMDYLPSRFSVLTKGSTEAKVEQAVKALERARFVVVDRKSQELLVRSYVRHDGVLDRVNMGKAVARALEHVVSKSIRSAILAELARLYGEKPTLPGWVGFRDLAPDAYAMTCEMASTMPLPIASGAP